ncbi:MAG TPA: 2-oxo-4-hydroxy-4-carboxy-5-ureidoimidazoline decarboxylase [Candidatus Eisenbacteria bacterium]|nr:2-oxo-4-hydroxy-4-carboxy-5-ureidoimidazoline decarboxylase [Candidatus Eisenbacteria bacterium]
MNGDISTIEAATAADAQAELAPLFEGAPAFLARLLAARPFGSWDRLFERARAIAHEMAEREQVELVDAHPRLGAAPAAVSAMSYREQGYDREAKAPTREVAAQLARLNDAYESQFGFRYCVFVAGRSRQALLPEMEAALTADREAELHRALDAVVDIAQDRHRSLRGTALGGDRSAAPADRSPASPRSAT